MEQLVLGLSDEAEDWEELQGMQGDGVWQRRVKVARVRALGLLQKRVRSELCAGECALQCAGFRYWQLAMGLEEYSGYQLGCMAHQMDQALREKFPAEDVREAEPIGGWYARCFGLPKGEEYKIGMGKQNVDSQHGWFGRGFKGKYGKCYGCKG